MLAAFFRHRIITAGVEGMAAQQAYDGQGYSSKKAETFNGLHRVVGARRVEAAGLAQQWANH